MLPPTLSWIDVQFVQKVLRSSENDDSINVTDLTLEIATMPGDNELSDMVRAGVKYSGNKSGSKEIVKKSLIVKVFPAGNKDMATELAVFSREIEMMTNHVVRMTELLNEEGCRLCAHVFYTDNGEVPFIVMEDLAVLGYRMCDRVAGLDFEHSMSAMRGIAKLHASSVALWEKDPKSLESYTKGVFHKDNPPVVKKMFMDGIKIFARELLNWSELGDSARSYSDKFMKISDVCYEKAIECAQAKVGDFNVLNHGDFWINNILFRDNDEDKVVDSILVDFQLCWWSTPAVDIINFSNTSFAENVEVHHIDAVLEEYLDTLTKTMTKLRCSTKAPTMKEFKKILRDHQFLEILYACVYFPITITPRDAAQPIEWVLKQGENYINPAYKGLEYRRRMLRRLSVWNSSGVLDI